MKKNKFQLKREATYQLLLEAGMKCFSEKGYAATTLGDIVERTGHTKGAFYGHFQSKEELFFHVVDYRFQLTRGWTDLPRSYHPSEKSLEDMLLLVLTALGEMMKGVNNWSAVLLDFAQQTKHNPELQSQLHEKYKLWVGEIETLIRNLQEAGWIAPDKDPHQTAVQVIAFREGYQLFASQFGGGHPQALIRGLTTLMTSK